MGTGKTTTGPRKRPRWEKWNDEQLLELPIRELDLSLENSRLETPIARIQRELADRDLNVKPHFWLSDEWFTPLGVPGVAIPFFLAHPRLMRLERAQMLQVEGGTTNWCMRILRHEIGHVLENAFHLRRRRKRQQIFGKSSTPYPDAYLPRPYSKSFVLHLDSWYAQSHPDEDFAETFAVWLTPKYPWKRRYAKWKALKKLEYMDELMQELAGKTPPVRSRKVVDPISKMTKTLGTYYAEKRERYAVDYPRFYDRDLRRLFTGNPEDKSLPSAANFIRKFRRQAAKPVSRWTGVYGYTIKLVMDDMIERSRDLGLRLAGSEEEALVDFRVLLTVQTMNFIHEGRHHIAL